jgi:hypothetical protein
LDPLATEWKALTVQVMDKEVVLLGPRVAIALTAAAAAETARRLADAAAEAEAAACGLSLPQASQTLSREE